MEGFPVIERVVPGPTTSTPSSSQKVVVTDIEMPFGSMVSFMVKWAIASIPALIILTIIGLIATAFFAAIIRT